MKARTRVIALIASIAVIAPITRSPLAAQHPFATGGQFDPAVPAPRTVLGHDVGERFTPHHVLGRYLERLAATSRRVRVDTVARTFEGREVFLVIVSSEANMARLEQLRADAARLADPRGAPAAELSAVAARALPTVWLGYTVHGGEASGTEAAIALLYQLAAGRDEATRMILDSLVVLIDPVQNPDGHERHVQDVMRNRGAGAVPVHPSAMVHQGNWPGPRTSHYYFDLNRDWFLLSHPETRGRVAAFRRWWPMTAVDLHEMGTNSTYFFAPPMAPVNKNVPAGILRWWDIYAAANSAAFDQHGWPYFRREGYDEFYPGYGVSWPILTGAVGMTYEEASSAGGAVRRTDGTVLTLHDAAWHHYTAAWATLAVTAQRARERVRDYLAFRQSAIEEAARHDVRAIAFEHDDDGRADSLASLLLANGIEVRRVPGSYVVDFAQPQGRLARAILESDAVLDSSFIREEIEARRTGESDRFYDLTAWSLPMAYRLRARNLRSVPAGAEPVTEAVHAPSPVPAARHGYAFAPGSEAGIRMLAALLSDSVRVWYARRPFTHGGASFPRGAFIVRVSGNGPAVHDKVRRAAEASGAAVAPLASAAADSGTDLGSNSVIPIRPPNVGLIGGAPVQGNAFGFTWYAFDQRLHYPVTTIAVTALAGARLSEFDVLILPSVSAAALDNVLGEGGRSRLASWVREGGTLITLDAATAWVAQERVGLTRLRLRRDTVRADSAGGAALGASVPGAIARASGDSLSPLLAGIRGEIPVLVNSDRIYSAPRDLRAGEALVRFAPADRLRLSGYFWPEVPARLGESVYLWTETAGRGRVIAFAGDPNFRDHFRGLLPLFANAVFLGPSM